MAITKRWHPLPAFIPTDHSDGWTTAYPITYTGQGMRLELHDAFDTDLASIPKLLRGIISVNGKHRLAALLHDYLYTYEVGHGMARAEADAMFLEERRMLGVKKAKRYAMYWAVRAFGWARV